jgi:S1-C subfamily serine protease
MKKVLTLIILIVSSFQVFAQDMNYAEINFIGYMGYGRSRKLYLNDHLVTSFGDQDIVNYKIYSKGRITVTFLSEYVRAEGVIEIKENKTYYYEGGNPETVNGVKVHNQGVDKEIFEAFKENIEKRKKITYNVITMEEDKNEPIAKLSATIEEGPKQGTCFLINKQGCLLTNYHVISGAKSIQVQGIGNDFSTLYGTEVLAFDVDLDLAIIKLKNQNITFDAVPYNISIETTPQGTKSFVLGYPLTKAMGEEIKVTEGIISAKSGYKGTISQYQFSAAIQPGNSGSPLFNENGDVVGVINAKLLGAESAGYAIKSQYVRTFLNLIDNFQFENPKTNLSSLSLTDKIAKLKNYIFIVKTE